MKQGSGKWFLLGVLCYLGTGCGGGTPDESNGMESIEENTPSQSSATLTLSADTFTETQTHNGLLDLVVKVLLVGDQFSVPETTFLEGTHYILEEGKVPDGLTLGLTRLQAAAAVLGFQGNALNHGASESRVLKIRFLPAIFKSGLSPADGSDLKTLNLQFVDTPIVLYRAAGWQGNLGGRSGVDSKCRGWYGTMANATHRGFISIDATDEIRDMPVNYGIPVDVPVVDPSGTLIANSWFDLLSGALAADLSSLFDPPQGFSWWSGSNADGSLGDNCSGWTSNSSVDNGSMGTHLVGNGWLAGEGVLSCDGGGLLLCISYQ